MTRNKIIVLNLWSALEETVRYLHTYEESEKVKIIHQEMQVSGVSRGNRKLYTPEVLVRAFSYYAVSRSLYERLRNDYQLPSVSTLARITSSSTKSSSSEFLKLPKIRENLVFFMMRYLRNPYNIMVEKY